MHSSENSNKNETSNHINSNGKKGHKNDAFYMKKRGLFRKAD